MVGTISERSEEIVASTRPSGGVWGGTAPPVRKGANTVTILFFDSDSHIHLGVFYMHVYNLFFIHGFLIFSIQFNYA